MSAAEHWLRERLEGVPPELLEEMTRALGPAEGDAADQLAAAAVSLYRRVANGGGGREDALPLLAADALFTHAFEARALEAPDRLLELAERWGGAGTELPDVLPSSHE